MKKVSLILFALLTVLSCVALSNAIIVIKTGGNKIHYFGENKTDLDYEWAKKYIIGFDPQFDYYREIKTNTEVTPRLFRSPLTHTDTVKTSLGHLIPEKKN